MLSKVYVAGPSRKWQEARKVMEFLENRNVRVTLRWDVIAENAQTVGLRWEPSMLKDACLGALERAEGLVVLYHPRWHSVGMWAEVGWALARKLPMVVVHMANDTGEIPLDHCWLGERYRKDPQILHADTTSQIYNWTRSYHPCPDTSTQP
jgi:hypothetical protein